MLIEGEMEMEKLEIKMATGDSIPNSLPNPATDSTETTSLAATFIKTPVEIVRTLFVSGLPMDTTPRELYLLFRNFKGFVESRLSTARNKYGKILSPVGFVSFSMREEAEEALKSLQDATFDPYLQNTLRLEFAKCNSKIFKDNSKKPYSPSPTMPTATIANPTFLRNSPPVNFVRESSGQNHHIPWNQSSGTPMLWQRPSANNAFGPGTGGQELSSYFNHEGYVDSVFGSSSNVLSSPSLYSLPSTPSILSSQTLASQSPCSTLFVANLGSFVGEHEVAELFGSCPGYVNARLYTKGLSPVAFVKFLDIRCASQAMMTLQGAFLRYSGRGGIRIEYAKSKMSNLDEYTSLESVGFTGGDNNHNGWTPYPLVPVDSWIDDREPRDWSFTGLDCMQYDAHL